MEQRYFEKNELKQVELVGWRERRGSVQSSIITRTTHYDAGTGGFVTEVDIIVAIVIIFEISPVSVCVRGESRSKMKILPSPQTWQ